MEVIITIKRNGEDKGKAYLLAEVGDSKKGTYKVFSGKENADLPSFCKVYVKASRDKSNKAS